MRDAFGGSFMIKLFLTFFIIYIVFIAIGLNIAKAYRVKNRIIDIIEQSEGYCKTDNAGVSALEKINKYLGPDGVNYNPGVHVDSSICLNAFLNDSYCIRKVAGVGSTNYYAVDTYVSWYFSFFKLGGTFKISGETRIITNDTC